ncbi:tensin-2 isoform X2 [Denticeps clupeoides]|uniref:tensin-2 isoform X2 n=1 Tax=Denticeps clupeoides TaxID=299321 RepID=UPI0010A30774|nr:tensin-2-like isoform X2 [Denticeps clupeoides]
MGCVHSDLCCFRQRGHMLVGPPQTRECPDDCPEILSLTELGKTGPHAFKAKSFKKKHQCGVCRQTIDTSGCFCKESKMSIHKKCEAKASSSRAPSSDPGSSQPVDNKLNNSLCSESVERVMDVVMERHYDFDLTYITERIICVFFLLDLDEERYHNNIKEVAAMLKSRHQDKFLLLNLSEKRHDISRLNPKVQDFGWPDLHAPPLDKICAMCKAMESWLTSDPQHVVVLHCKGNKGKTGVIIAAYMHYSKISAGADQALSTVAMRKFCEDKISHSLQPSQNRYIYYFGGLLSGSIKLNSNALFLHQVLIPTLPNFQSGGGYSPFLKIYQSLQLVYTSGIYDVQASRGRRVCVTLEPALQLKGDVMVKCYHRHAHGFERECVFRVQFHTCTVHGAQLWFGKEELDKACKDDRFPSDAKVEFVFSYRPETIKGRAYQKNDPGVTVDYGTSDPVVRWDSYENFNLHHQDSTEDISHTRGPLDGSLYAQVKKRRAPGSNGCPNGMKPPAQPPSQAQPQSSNRDLGNSLQPSGLQEEKSPKPPPKTCRERVELEFRPAREKTRSQENDRETAILDDGETSPRRPERHSCCARPYSPRALYDPAYLPSGIYVGSCDLVSKSNQKHRTLPTSRTSPPPMLEPCLSYPDLMWERGRCVHHSCSQTPSRHLCPQDIAGPLSHPHHPHTLTALPRAYCSGEVCPLYHCSSHSNSQIPPSRSLPQPLPPSPYRELRFISSPATTCPCPDCARLRRVDPTFHSIQSDQSENFPWAREVAFGYRREGSLHWEREQEQEFWHRHSLKSPYTRRCHSPQVHDLTPYLPDPPPPGTTSMSSPFPSPHSSSSGYHTPQATCPCSPSPHSPPPSRESNGYASGVHSRTTSPAPPSLSLQRPGVSEEALAQSQTLKEAESPSSQPRPCTDDDVKVTNSLSQDLQRTTHTDTGSAQNGDKAAHPEDSPCKREVEDKFGSNGSPNQAQPQCLAKQKGDPSEDSASKPPPCEVDTVKESGLPSGGLRSSPVLSHDSLKITGSDLQSNGCPDTEEANVVSITDFTPSTPRHSTASSDQRASSESSMFCAARDGLKLKPVIESSCSSEEDSTCGDLRAHSPVPDGCATPSFPLASYYYSLLTVPHVPYTGYTAITIPTTPPQPPLPEKRRPPNTTGSPSRTSTPTASTGCPSGGSSTSSSVSQLHVTFSPTVSERPASPHHKAAVAGAGELSEPRVTAKFVQDSSKFWYKPGISRDQAIAVLKGKEPGSFLIRDSNSFHGAYGLALRVATPPPSINNHGNKGDPLEHLVRHFLIESGPRGVKIKGCQNETYFGSLSALVYQHSITPISLPCALVIPEKDLVGELQELQGGTNTSTASDLLKQGAACNVLYLNSVETESLTGPQAISKATRCTLTQEPHPTGTVVHFKVSAQGITLTDSQRKVFFRRHYPISSVTFSCVDPQDRRIFGFVAKRPGSASENVCHLFAELDPEQPATAIVNFINKVMLGPHLRR